jgi:23S rRNA (uracil1939-C5)-methyltransferase
MKKGSIVEGVEIVDIGVKGKVIGKKEGQVYMLTGAVPGDVVTVQVRKNKKSYKEAMLKSVDQLSADRTTPECAFFEHCGGCNWQNFQYDKQLELKGLKVNQQIRRLGGFEGFEAIDIMGAPEQYFYRNKLEFTFVDQRWLTPEEIKNSGEITRQPGLGFHVPGRFDWVLHIDKCHLLNDTHNHIRNFIYETAVAKNISFYSPHGQVGTLRNMVLRSNLAGEWMLLLMVKDKSDDVRALTAEVGEKFPEIKSLFLVHNTKVNDNYSDCPVELIKGEDHIIESFERVNDGGKVKYIIGPKSFFQTNTKQAQNLYRLVYDWADIKPNELVYDLYTGTGSIALFVADKAKHVVGVEYVPEAIEDAKKNAALNGVENTSFFAGDMKDILNSEFIAQHGKPDVLITDPPRAGMHEDVVNRILEAEPKRVVYVSCDPATQARDMALMKEKYELVKIQPVDMFPHTSHVENVALLILKNA